ncbi:uncharacterized protein PGTG_09316 [Puccinia graminis f. sp. tritici CRL 75-36-700-3]|uniref:Uncharacterized protein n=1 Tax=Puccinia graminis f. sp. tritici (strain CRL 75-36-700-3 / race SCCL) TaxID=418459 RepID=E3KH28_PUCGT|nr:uncharacterized protein PGTG_09316 [Puccinia graminis f. sp. tritici CRL 75-36-700-3]EFP83603.2 hypothetical protein PGTG_09316 [Puccinia graminis f. sp. tritici CRL 75-36-700-3]
MSLITGLDRWFVRGLEDMRRLVQQARSARTIMTPMTREFRPFNKVVCLWSSNGRLCNAKQAGLPAAPPALKGSHCDHQRLGKNESCLLQHIRRTNPGCRTWPAGYSHRHVLNAE